MSTPIVDASNVAGIIAAFKAANGPAPSSRKPSSRDDGQARHAPERSATLVTLGARPPASVPTLAPLQRAAPPPFPDVDLPIPTPRQPCPPADPAPVRDNPAPAIRLLLAAAIPRPAVQPIARPPELFTPPPAPGGATAPAGSGQPPVFASAAPMPEPLLSPTSAISQPVDPASDPDPHVLFLGARATLNASYSAFAGGARLASAVLAKSPPPELLQNLDRRTLFAIATDVSGLFSNSERKAALDHLGRLAGTALRPGAMPALDEAERLAGYVTFLDAAGPEEKRSPEWSIERAAARFAQERLSRPEALGEDAPDVRGPMVALLKSAFETFSGLAPRVADQALAPLALRDMPFIVGFLTQEMLLAALAIIRQTGSRLPEDEARPGRRRLAATELPGAGESLILPLEPRWRSPGEALARVEAWEARSGLILPDAYRRFIEAFDGGRVYPNMFALAVLDEDGSIAERFAMLDRLYAWADVESSWDASALEGQPPTKLVIGQDAQGANIVLSLAGEKPGSVCLRQNGEGAVQMLAPSFELFIARLGDVPGLAGFRRWSRSAFRSAARRLAY